MRSLFILLCACAALLLSAPVNAQTNDGLVQLRELYHAAADDEAALEPTADALADLSRLRPDDPVLRAYSGAIHLLRAKYGFWPHRRLDHLLKGRDDLTEAVLTAPNNVEVRYLRALNCWFLPGMFREGCRTEEDLEFLAAALPNATAYPREFRDQMISFVISTGWLDDTEGQPRVRPSDG